MIMDMYGHQEDDDDDDDDNNITGNIQQWHNWKLINRFYIILFINLIIIID